MGRAMLSNSLIQFSVDGWGCVPSCCESATVNMPENLENLAVATGLKKVSFNANPKERHC